MTGRSTHPKVATPPWGAEGVVRDLFEASPIGIYRADLEGRFLQVNAALAGIYGFEDPEAMLRDLQSEGPPRTLWEDPGERAAFLRRVFEGPAHYHHGEARFLRRDGSLLLARVDMMLTTTPATDAPCLVGYVQDLTERRLTEEALLETQRLLEAAVTEAPVGVIIADGPEGRLRYVNRIVREILDLGEEVATIEGMRALLPTIVFHNPEGRQLAWEELPLVKAIRKGETVRSQEMRVQLPNGVQRWVLSTASPIRDAQGRITAGLSVLQESTERHRTEHEIQRLKAELANIIDSMPSLLVCLDEGGRVTLWNREAEAATGVPAEAAQGRTFQELLPPFAPQVAALRADVARLGQPSAKEKVLLERDGERQAFEVMVYPLTDPGSGDVVVRIEDVTERARIQELFVQAEKLMSIGGLAAGMAHEINNPLGIISQAAQNVGRRLTADLPANVEAARAAGLDLAALQRYLQDRRIQPFLDSIQEAVGRATKIVGNLLELSRKPESARVSASLLEVVQRTLALAARDYDLKKRFGFGSIDVQLEAEGDLPLAPMVVAELEQVLLNLLKNAAQALAGNGPERPRRLWLRLRREGAHLVLEVEDNGPGMNETVRRRIFEPFFTTRGPGLGTGLGLSVSYMIVVQNHKGSLEVASTEGEGTCFTLRLPLGEAHA